MITIGKKSRRKPKVKKPSAKKADCKMNKGKPKSKKK